MKKLQLDLSELRVESFEVKSDSGGGTVRAHEGSGNSDCYSFCPQACSMNISCGQAPDKCLPYDDTSL